MNSYYLLAVLLFSIVQINNGYIYNVIYNETVQAFCATQQDSTGCLLKNDVTWQQLLRIGNATNADVYDVDVNSNPYYYIIFGCRDCRLPYTDYQSDFDNFLTGYKAAITECGCSHMLEENSFKRNLLDYAWGTGYLNCTGGSGWDACLMTKSAFRAGTHVGRMNTRNFAPAGLDLYAGQPQFAWGMFPSSEIKYLDLVNQNNPPLDGNNIYDQPHYCYNCQDSAMGTVVVIDSGVDINHYEFLTDPANVSRAFVGGTFLGTNGAQDERVPIDGHGTSVAAIVAGRNLGIARKPKVYSYGVIYEEGSVSYEAFGASMIDIMNKVSSGAYSRPVVGVSALMFIEYYDHCVSNPFYDPFDCLFPVHESVKLAYGFGIFWHFPAGNGYNNVPASICTVAAYGPTYNYHIPLALMFQLILVGVHDDNWKLGVWAHTAPEPLPVTWAGGSNYGDCVQIMAPGINISRCAWPLTGPATQYQEYSITSGYIRGCAGTSYSTPMVAGGSISYASSKSAAWHNTNQYSHIGQQNRQVEEIRTAILQNAPYHNTPYGAYPYFVVVPIDSAVC